MQIKRRSLLAGSAALALPPSVQAQQEKVVRYGIYMTDIPLLEAWGRPLLYGPGSVLVAHTDAEFVEIADLERAARDYVRLVRELTA